MIPNSAIQIERLHEAIWTNLEGLGLRVKDVSVGEKGKVSITYTSDSRVPNHIKGIECTGYAVHERKTHSITQKDSKIEYLHGVLGNISRPEVWL